MTRGVVAAGVLVLAVASLLIGEPFVGLNRLPHALTAGDGIENLVVLEVRAPRLVLAVVAGAALGMAGLLLQESLRNPLAVPELLGVSSGAGAAVTVCVVFGIAVPGAPVVPALAGAAAGAGLTLLAIRGAQGPAAALLSGAAVSAAFQAVLLAAAALADSRDQGVLVRYLLGSLSGTSWADLSAAGPALLLAAPLAVLAIPALGVLRLGDDAAASLGLRAARARTLVLAIACVLVAVVVAYCGPIAWTGFLAPHLARAAAPGAGHAVHLATSALFGAVLVQAADLLARSVLYPVELPAGGLTAVVAICAGALLLVRRGRRAAA